MILILEKLRIQKIGEYTQKVRECVIIKQESEEERSNAIWEYI